MDGLTVKPPTFIGILMIGIGGLLIFAAISGWRPNTAGGGVTQR